MTKRQLEMDRHLRLAGYVLLSFVLTTIGYLFMEFDRLHAMAYGISAFVLLNTMNYRVVLTKIDTARQPRRHRQQK